MLQDFLQATALHTLDKKSGQLIREMEFPTSSIVPEVDLVQYSDSLYLLLPQEAYFGIRYTWFEMKKAALEKAALGLFI